MVTDTAMVCKDDKVYAFGPVVRELDVFLELFGTVRWIGFDRPDLCDDPVMLPVPEAVQCILLQRSGGDSLLKKGGVLARVPWMGWQILRQVVRHEAIHTRAPSSPAFIAALLSFFFRKKIWWHKYAGNWGQEGPPFFYGLQRAWLKKATWGKATINGRWPEQPAHCLSFDNPCLSEEERSAGRKVLESKSFDGPLNICFTGHLSIPKGANYLLDALPLWSGRGLLGAVHIVGDGPLRTKFEQIADQLDYPLILHGYLPGREVAKVMAACHLQVLPSRSEGFPKVIAEGANYGCVPVVSDISAIGQTVQHGVHGFLLSPDRIQAGYLAEDTAAILRAPNLAELAWAAYQLAERFTFERYKERIQREILAV